MLEEYVVGVDGGGAKTTAILADLQGKILARAKTGSSHPRYLGIKKAVDSAAFVIEKVLRKIGKNSGISATFLGLPGMEEEFRIRRGLVKRELLKHKEISRIFKGKIVIGSDQLAGFRSGTDEEDGLALIGGSGSTCHGWKGGREIKIDGWGYLSETGSAFFVGRRTLQTVLKEIDGRNKKTLLAKKVLRGLGVKNKEQLIRLVYSKFPMEIIPSLSTYCNAAAEAGEKSASNILIGAGKELALSAKTAINELGFSKNKFPLVLVGSMFNSKIILDVVKKEIRKFAPKVNFIRPEAEPAVGAVKLAIGIALDEIAENLKRGKVIVCPTDTVYGLITIATDKKAVDKIFKIKKRSKTMPLPIFVDNLDAARKLAIMGGKQEKFLKKVWPGKTTVVLKRKTKTKLYGVADETIALRVPKYKLVNDLLARVRIPLTGTSANISGEPATGRIKDVLKQFQGKKFQPDLVVNAGNLKRAKPSTIISLISSKPEILRK
jgi:tRNA threonylcarbamoyl adenosine modification protein (Sua5/YciO/YrdC/YwlC family)